MGRTRASGLAGRLRRTGIVAGVSLATLAGIGASGVLTTAARASNPFGVMLPPRLASSGRGVEVARTLGVRYVRPDAVLTAAADASCPTCGGFRQAGFELVLTLRNTSAPRVPSRPPGDLEGWRQTVDRVLTRYRPRVLVVENEENSAWFYTGAPEEYGAQLKAACQVAHARGVSCTNGGPVSTLVALLVYDRYRTSGQLAMARDFAARAFPPEVRRQLDSPEARRQIEKGKALLSAYRDAGADYVNFHWYVADTRALEEAAAYLRAQTGLPVITNEIGQHAEDPNQTTAVMSKVMELGLPVAVWLSVDAPKARGLVNLDGSLRPTGEAFRSFVLQHVAPGWRR
ncbi:MAG: hypothetical protein QN196_09620 [Armatimonadota bacterium]|nr:hypothetical protein [Armatimonadota bacterium]MDR7394791.1 hypothetical protein [Armatimonadota bacterium]MDR7397483.1 hypothetical protein [Armatimonadota bacterium]MDR7605164.1 hypothetical protein [Armatimonadota bacterium]